MTKMNPNWTGTDREATKMLPNATVHCETCERELITFTAMHRAHCGAHVQATDEGHRFQVDDDGNYTYLSEA